MLKKMTGILILLSFLLVKSTSLFAIHLDQKNAITFHAAQDGEDNTNTDNDKETKQIEIADEDFIAQPIQCPAPLMLSAKVGRVIVPRITAPNIRLPYPPPNGRS